MISWKCTKEEHKLIVAIAQRAVAMAASARISYGIQEAMMDINAVHSNGCPLRLADLAAADDSNFGHDVFGIRRHIDRTTGKLTDGFLPRYSQPQRESRTA